MTPFEHLKAKLKHAQSIDADMVRVDIEELASVLEELKLLKNERKEKSQVIDEFKNKLWEDIETRYKNDVKILGYLSADNLLRDVHNAICYFAEQIKKEV